MIYLALASFIWAFSYGLTKGNLTQLSPDFVAWARMAIPFLLFLPLFKTKSLSLKTMLYFLGIGAVQYGLMYLFVIRAYQYLPAYQIVLFTAFTPIYVTLIDNLITRTFKPFYLFTSALAFVSVVLLYSQSFHGSIQGFILVQLSDICFAFGQIAYKKIRSREKTLQDKNLYALLFFGGTLITTLSTSIFHGWGSLSEVSFKQALVLLYLGAISSGLSFFWWNRAAVTTNAGVLAVFNNLKLPLGVLVSLVVFKEKAGLLNLFAAFALIGVALVLAQRCRRDV